MNPVTWHLRSRRRSNLPNSTTYTLPTHLVTFIAHPKTASTTVAAVLLELGFEKKGTHHEFVPPEDGWSVDSTIRQLLNVIVSWYFHYAKHNAQMPSCETWQRKSLRSHRERLADSG